MIKLLKIEWLKIKSYNAFIILSSFFALGVVTGLSRLADDAHWFSDIVAGATVGIMFGRASFKHHLEITPMVMRPQEHGYGLLASWRF